MEYKINDNFKIINDNSLNMLNYLDGNSVDCIVTDPPYELDFMSKGWDKTGIAFNVKLWKKCYEVLKPGGYLLAFGGSRTFHRMACAIEDAGFEIRDTIMWLYGSGFPKAQDVALMIDKKNGCSDRGHRIAVANRFHPDGTLEPNGETSPEYEPRTKDAECWKGWKTALKPAFEPIIMARKPLEKNYAENTLKYGVGGLNIDECRIKTNDFYKTNGGSYNGVAKGYQRKNKSMFTDKQPTQMHENGRYPANVILTYDETDFDEVCGGMPETTSSGGEITNPVFNQNKDGFSMLQNKNVNRYETNYIAPQDSGSAARYFYCAKASKRDRDEGLDQRENKIDCDRNINCYSANVPYNRSNNIKRNIHPTVKPTDLMQYLIRLVAPKNATILDVFNGSGSTGKAVAYENHDRNKNYKYIGFELEKDYVDISIARIKAALDKPVQLDLFSIIDDEKGKQYDKHKQFTNANISLF